MADPAVPTPAGTPSEAGQHPLAALLRAQGLQQVVVVDDYYDPPEHLELSPRDADDLWGLLEFEDDAQAELAALGHTVSGPESLSGPVLSSFLANRERCPAFDAQWQRSIAGQRREEQSAQLTRIEGHLRGALGLWVAPYGSNASVEEMARGGAQLFLLDWRLGDDDDEAAIEAAVRKAKDIHEHWPPGQPRPLIVLMSSAPGVTARAEEFRRRSRLLAGMFHAVPKAELTDEFSLQMHLQTLAMSLPAGHRVQEFVEALCEKVRTVGDEFIERISALTLSDYAYIQSLSLQADGQPLGDYLMWLFSAYFGHLLFSRALREQRDGLDALTFTPLPSKTVPSPQLAEMYRYALFDVDIGPVTSHPRAAAAPAGTMQGDVVPAPNGDAIAQAVDAGDPMLSLGDVFVPVGAAPAVAKEGAGADALSPAGEDLAGAAEHGEAHRPPDLAMVINAQCDLAFAPEGGRTIERGRSILLLPGTLHPIREPVPDRYKDAPRTELYEHEGRSYRVLWNTKEVKTVPYGEFRRWHDGADAHDGTRATPHERKARLRLPFALEVQRAFAADLTRVGMPVAPPIYQAVDVRLLRATGKRFDQDEAPGDSEAAFLVLSRDGHKIVQQCVLTLPLVQRLRRMVEARLTSLEDQLSGGASDKRLEQQLQTQVDALRRTIANNTDWAKLLSPIDMPTETRARPFVGGYIQIVRNKSVGHECPTDKVIAAVSLQEGDR
ncbi:MAG: hypothetical protein IT306_10460 [Chloroflexi bacterium]|nr:hypothetical protein [Chloroflexota bacterium]